MDAFASSWCKFKKLWHLANQHVALATIRWQLLPLPVLMDNSNASQIVTCWFPNISATTCAAFMFVFDVSHPIGTIIKDIHSTTSKPSAQFSDKLHSYFAITIHLYKLVVNSQQENMFYPYTGLLFDMMVRVLTTCHLVLQMQPHVISFYGVTSRIRFMFLLFPQVSQNWRYESEPPL